MLVLRAIAASLPLGDPAPPRQRDSTEDLMPLLAGRRRKTDIPSRRGGPPREDQQLSDSAKQGAVQDNGVSAALAQAGDPQGACGLAR